jgi:hypothetical protein
MLPQEQVSDDSIITGENGGMEMRELRESWKWKGCEIRLFVIERGDSGEDNSEIVEIIM